MESQFQYLFIRGIGIIQNTTCCIFVVITLTFTSTVSVCPPVSPAWISYNRSLFLPKARTPPQFWRTAGINSLLVFALEKSALRDFTLRSLPLIHPWITICKLCDCLLSSLWSKILAHVWTWVMRNTEQERSSSSLGPQALNAETNLCVMHTCTGAWRFYTGF